MYHEAYCILIEDSKVRKKERGRSGGEAKPFVRAASLPIS